MEEGKNGGRKEWRKKRVEEGKSGGRREWRKERVEERKSVGEKEKRKERVEKGKSRGRKEWRKERAKEGKSGGRKEWREETVEKRKSERKKRVDERIQVFNALSPHTSNLPWIIGNLFQFSLALSFPRRRHFFYSQILLKACSLEPFFTVS